MKKIILIISLFLLAFIASNAQVAVIANKSISVAKINLATLNNIYSLEQVDLGGTKVQLFDLAEESGAKSSFYNALGKPAAEFKKIWMKKKLTGNGNPPKPVASEDDMLAKVASTPGAIGFVSASKVNSSVKVILEIK